jgi:LVIVD repeat-containing protein
MASMHQALAIALLSAAACAHSSSTAGNAPAPSRNVSTAAPSPDPRIGLRAGNMDAAEATWNLRILSKTPPSGKFLGSTNSDLAFTGNYVIQGNYNGYQIWDISNPSQPVLKVGNYCPASQSDVSVYKSLLFVSAEGSSGHIDCSDQPIRDTVSTARIRGIRIFDISDITHPRNITNVQTCRGSHTHSLLVDPKDPDNVYVYVSGSAGIRSPTELPGCVLSADDPNTARFRIEVIKVPLAHPEQAAIVSSPRIFQDLAVVKSHGSAPDDIAAVAAAKARGEFVVSFFGQEQVLPSGFSKQLLDSVAKSHSRTAPTAADSAELRAGLPAWVAARIGTQQAPNPNRPGVTSCHDITLYPGIGMAGGACEGYGLLIDIKDPAHPVRVAAVADTNFSYWHSATFNNDGTKLLFSDEWGGGGAPKCRASDPKEWGADAIFTIVDGKLQFQSYYKLPAAQTPLENCVAHNGSLIPIPGRDVMVQAWYQGGISVFDWTDAAHPKEIAFFDRGPLDSTRFSMAGSWSVYWYNGVIVSSEIARGLDILELTPSGLLSQNEIDAAKTVRYEYLNTQGQPKMVWPPSFALARAYLDQLERSKGLTGDKISSARKALHEAEEEKGAERREELNKLATQLDADASAAGDAAKVKTLAAAVRDLANASR